MLIYYYHNVHVVTMQLLTSISHKTVLTNGIKCFDSLKQNPKSD